MYLAYLVRIYNAINVTHKALTCYYPHIVNTS